MSDFILEYDILESIVNHSNSLGKRSAEYSESLERKIISAIGSVTGPSSGYLEDASDSVRDKINALKLKSEAFYHFAEQITNLIEVAEQMDQEVADAIAAQREYFLDHHESLRIDDWKAKLLDLLVDMKNSIPVLGTIADILNGLDTIFESLKDSIKHWYECEGGKQIFEVIGSVVEVGIAVGFLALAVAALAIPGAGVFAICGVIGAGIAFVNSVTNVATSFRAADAAIDGNPAWAMIYGKQDKLSDVIRQTNFGSGTLNNLSNFGAKTLDITETLCVIAGFAEAGVGIAKLFKGDAFKLLKNKDSLNFSDLKSGVKNGIVDLKSNIKQGYTDLKNGINGIDKVGDVAKVAGNPNDIGYMKNLADPMRDVLGSGRLSNPEKWNSIINELKKCGVEINYSEGSMAYAPGLQKGNPGQIKLDPDASLSALKHEYQHFLDAQDEGFPSFGQQMFENPTSRVIKELRAYMVEIKEADSMGLKDVAEQLFENYRQEREWIVNQYILPGGE